ncbi:hypothetical protein B0H10DRAFT_1941834 [Mycena sp. CBHHK59/15]|nr:hypothetical protein B0H10DRAFT_1941834 [Mycena sp. CBHHK59/15]
MPGEYAGQRGRLHIGREGGHRESARRGPEVFVLGKYLGREGEVKRPAVQSVEDVNGTLRVGKAVEGRLEESRQKVAGTAARRDAGTSATKDACCVTSKEEVGGLEDEDGGFGRLG